MPIKILDPQTVSKIAAGEVVERPASVVKELVENALDASASQITVETEGGGVTLIKVTDNGSGIPADEVELAFTRHATSKISALSDLEKIATLGFRGEALPSIAAVADVELITRAASDAAASYLHIANGKVIQQEKRSRPQGTTVSMHHLFRHFPARLKFLKSPTTENSHIVAMLTQYAFAFPEVKFSLTVDGRFSLRTPGNGNLRDAVAELYSLEVARQMIETNETDQGYTVRGLISPPSLSRSSRNYLSFFINRRWVHSSLLTRAVEDAYRGLLMVGKHPIAIINVSIPPQELDVNVHPSKTEVKFRNSQSVYSAVGKAIKSALHQAPPPQIRRTAPEQSAPRLFTAEAGDRAMPPTAIYATARPADSMVKDGDRPSLPILRVVGQLAASYIMAEGPEGLYLIDQHAAHERVIFDKVLAQRSQQQIEVQGLLEPATIELSPGQEQILKSRAELLGQFGFSLEHFGDRSYLLRAVPAVMAGANLTEAVHSLLDALSADEEAAKREQTIAQSLACHGAIKAGQQLSFEEMRGLIRQLEETASPRTCPHGRPTMIYLSSKQLSKEFGRT
jgi:DNA mismatch repair protein MutL